MVDLQAFFRGTSINRGEKDVFPSKASNTVLSVLKKTKKQLKMGFRSVMGYEPTDSAQFSPATWEAMEDEDTLRFLHLVQGQLLVQEGCYQTILRLNLWGVDPGNVEKNGKNGGLEP